MKIDNKQDTDKTLTLDEITAILDSGDFDKLISQRESEVFEAKPKRPYDLPKRKAIFKFVKSVASIGNNKGGYIICGLRTEKPQDSPHDYIKALDLTGKDEFYDESQLTGIVCSNIYPKLDIEVVWYPYKNEKKLGLGVIFVSEQDESKKYFITKITEVEGKDMRNYFGIPIRTDDDTKWLTIQELHRLSKRSPNNLQELHQSISNQIEEVKDMISSIPSTTTVGLDNIPAKIEETIYGNK